MQICSRPASAAVNERAVHLLNRLDSVVQTLSDLLSKVPVIHVGQNFVRVIRGHQFGVKGSPEYFTNR